MNVLITGGAGFLGSHLVEAYLSSGHTVTAIDNYATSTGENIDTFKAKERFRFVRADVAGPLPELDVKPDLILHFASPASPLDYARDPLGTLAVNGPGTAALCELAQTNDARFVFASTSEIYGDPLVHPQPETYFGNVNSLGPRSCYDEGKRYGEAVVASYRSQYGLDARIVRIFNTYGPRMRGNDGRVVPTFIMQALAGSPLTIFGDGMQTRSLCYVNDLIDGITRFAAIDNPAHTVINLGSDVEFTVNQIASTIALLCDVPLRTEFGDLPLDDPARRRPDLSRVREMLGWEPRTPLEDGLRATIEWFQQRPLAVTKHR